MDLLTPYDVLSAYSRAEISSDDAVVALGLDGFRELVVAMADAGHPLPRPHEDEVEAQLDAAMPLLLTVFDRNHPDA